MGRTLEALAGRYRRAAGREPVPPVSRRVPAPAVLPEPEPVDGPVLVPLTAGDLAGGQDGVPYIEVGGPRPKAPAGPQLRPPRLTPVPAAPEVAFQLLPEA